MHKLVLANKADYPITTKRFSVSLDNDTLVIDAQDITAFRAASNAVWNTFAVIAQMTKI